MQRQTLAWWTAALVGLDEGDVLAALDRVDEWNIAHVTDACAADHVDAAVAAYLLVAAVDRLVACGIDQARLLKKLRSDPGSFWSTWAEFRIAAVLSAATFADATVLLEDGRSAGAHADFRFVDVETTFGTSVEVKAVGLSDAEVDFCRRMAPALPRMLPSPQGIVTVHAPLSGAVPQSLGEIRRIGRTDSPGRSRTVPSFPTGMSAAVIAARGTEPAYVRRAAGKVAAAVRQLPSNGDSCWVALHWSNGAPMRAVLQAIDWATIPARVDGLLLVGTGVAFPDRNLHVFQAVQPREAAGETDAAELRSLRDGMQELAEAVLGRFERSTGVRATLVRVGRRDLIRRDGTLPIAPFNLLLDGDPDGLERSAP